MRNTDVGFISHLKDVGHFLRGGKAVEIKNIQQADWGTFEPTSFDLQTRGHCLFLKGRWYQMGAPRVRGRTL